MPDEATEGLEELEPQDNPEPSDPETSSDEPDYRTQYEELRSKFNERDEEIRNLRETQSLLDQMVPDKREQQAFLGALAAELEQGDLDSDEGEEELDDEEYGRRAYELVLEREQQLAREAQWADAQETFMDEIEALEKKVGIEFDDEDVRYFFHEATFAGRKPEDAFAAWLKMAERAAAYNATQAEKQAAAKAKAAKAPQGAPGTRTTEQEDTRDVLEREIEQAMGSAA
jgi:hypothetical protein